MYGWSLGLYILFPKEYHLIKQMFATMYHNENNFWNSVGKDRKEEWVKRKEERKTNSLHLNEFASRRKKHSMGLFFSCLFHTKVETMSALSTSICPGDNILSKLIDI